MIIIYARVRIETEETIAQRVREKESETGNTAVFARTIMYFASEIYLCEGGGIRDGIRRFVCVYFFFLLASTTRARMLHPRAALFSNKVRRAKRSKIIIIIIISFLFYDCCNRAKRRSRLLLVPIAHNRVRRIIYFPRVNYI